MSSRFDYEKIDVVQFLRGLGVRNIRDNGLEVSYSCPFDGHSREDSTPSASMSKVAIERDDGNVYPPTTFNCFTCGKAGNAVTFLSILEDVSPIIAKKMIRQQFGMAFREPSDSLKSELMKLIKPPPRTPSGINSYAHRLPEIPRESLGRFEAKWIENPTSVMDDSPYAYLVRDRGFSPSILTEFQVGVDYTTFRITIPIFDENDRLVGVKGRSFLPDRKPKYLVLGGEAYGFDTYETSKVLFALNKAKNSIWETGTVLVREGELNAISLHQRGYKNAIGFSGSYLSDTQAELIKKHAIHATLWFDDVNKARDAAKKLERTIPVYVCTWDKSDPAEMTAEEIQIALNRSLSSFLL